MKKIVLSTLIATGLAASQGALAADGTINFSGELTETTCTVVSADKNLTVTLPRVASNSLQTQGQTNGLTAFTINLEGCSASSTNARVYFEPRPNLVNTEGRVINTGTATNVDIQLLDSDSTAVIDARKNSGLQNTQYQTFTGATGSLNYYAQYYATAAATAGTVTGQVQYSVEYQ